MPAGVGNLARCPVTASEHGYQRLGALIALRAEEDLKFHFPIALRNGLTVEELEEVAYHVTGYAGFPAANTARAIGREALPRPRRTDN